jgi:PAS domain S-box-containing protein
MATPLRLLLVEDSEADAALCLYALKKYGYTPESQRVETATTLSAALAQHAWDIALLDYHLPGFELRHALQILQTSGNDMPVIVVSGVMGEEAAVEVMRAGARDFVSKERLQRLGPAIERELREATQRRAQRQAKAASQIAESRLRALIAHSHDAVSLIAPDGTILYVSPANERILGYQFDEMAGRPITDFIHPDDWAHLEQLADQLIADPTLHPKSHFRFKHKQDEWRWLEGVGTNLLADPAIQAFVVNYHDITEHKQLADALRASEAELRALFAALPDAILIFNTEGRYVKIPETARKPPYTTAEAMLGKTVYDFFPAPQANLFVNCIRQALSTRQIVHLEYQLFFPQGDLWFDANIAPITEDMVVWVARDITEQKHAEVAQQELERNLAETQKLESLGVLAGGIAHDFNNLLASVLGNVGLALLASELSEPVRNALLQIELAAKRANALTRQLLAYAGRSYLIMKPVDLNALVASLSQALRPPLGENITLTFNLAQTLPALKGDAAQLRQVMMHLLVNASEAIGSHIGTLTVTTGAIQATPDYLAQTRFTPQLPEGTYVYLEVSDTGCGMNEDTLAKIFEPFFTTKATGRGLGLSAVLGIVRGHNGALKIHSELGRGTTVRVLLPALQAESTPPTPLAQPAATKPTPGSILVIDDEAAVRAVAARMLERQGFNVFQASNGREGLRLLQTQGMDIQCVLLDMTMPELSGQEVFQLLRQQWPQLRILIMSGYAEKETLEKFSEQRWSGFLQKPFTSTELQEKIMQILTL